MADEAFKVPVEVNFTTTGAVEAKKAVQEVTTPALPALDDARQMAADTAAVRAMDEKTRTAARVTASNLSMGNSFQNVGYQIQDFAVQVGSGTSASRAFAQQAPQLLSAFGPWGVALGTIAAVGAPIAGQLLAMAGASDTAADASNKLAADTREAVEETVKLQRAQALAQSELAAAEKRAKDYAATLREVTKAGFEYNDVMREQIRLLKEQQAATNQVEEAKGQRRIEEAGDDPVKQEQVRNQVRKEAQTRELEQMRDEAVAKSDLIKRLQDQDMATQDRAAAEAAEKKKQADAAAAEAVQQEQTKTMQEAQEKSLRETAATNGRFQSDIKLLADADKAKAAAAAAGEAATANRSKEADLRKQAKDLEDTGTKGAADTQAEINKLYREIQSLSQRFETNKQVFAERDAAGDSRESRAKAAAWVQQQNTEGSESEKARQAQERDEAERRRNVAEATRAGGGLVQNAFDAADQASAAGAPKAGTDAVRKAAEVLSRDPSADHLAEMSDVIDKLVAWAERIGQQGEDPAKWRDLGRRMDTLEQQIRNK